MKVQTSFSEDSQAILIHIRYFFIEKVHIYFEDFVGVVKDLKAKQVDLIVVIRKAQMHS